MTIIKLPEKFNEYDPETLKHLQDVYLMMLKDFIKVCDENQIEYYLDGGSALGAVRHQGFIPWDDDIDIILFRDEYNRLIEILEKLPQDKYELLSSENKKCYCRLYSQWNLKGTKTEEYYDMNTDFTLGISLDIFVLDNIPNDGLRKKIFSIKQTLIRKLIWSYEITNSEAYISKNKEKMGKILKIIFKIFRINFTKIKKINNNFIEKYRNENCENVCNLSTTYELVPIPKNIFHPPKKVKFEDVEVNIPNDYDKYLKIIYGDNYMEIPPKEDRYNHIYNTVDFGHYE
nr:LicD family protein [Methanobrevibacter smithii]